jgi:general secretion pathway protein H
MPTSATGIKNDRKAMRLKTNGFTLVELLIVIVLIGVMSSMAVLAMGNVDHGKHQQLEAERLSKLLALAEQEATLRGESFAVELFADGYRFLSLEDRDWRTETGDDLFKPRTLDGAMRLTLKLDDADRPLQAFPSYKPQPQIIFTPDGTGDVFEIGIFHDDSDRLFTVGDSGEQGLQITERNLGP